MSLRLTVQIIDEDAELLNEIEIDVEACAERLRDELRKTLKPNQGLMGWPDTMKMARVGNAIEEVISRNFDTM